MVRVQCYVTVKCESIGGSLYWNRGSRTCYNGQNNAILTCDFSDLKETMVGKALWKTGINGYVDPNNILISKFYKLERSAYTGKIYKWSYV